MSMQCHQRFSVKYEVNYKSIIIQKLKLKKSNSYEVILIKIIIEINIDNADGCIIIRLHVRLDLLDKNHNVYQYDLQNKNNIE